MNRCLDCIQIWYGCSLGISDYLITFGINPLKTKWLPQQFKQNRHGGSVGHFFLLFLDIDGQSLRLRGPAIN